LRLLEEAHLADGALSAEVGDCCGPDVSAARDQVDGLHDEKRHHE
jgi:hypothetical protein